MKISYDPFWKTIKDKGLNQYILINKMGVRSSLIHKLRHDLDIRVSTYQIYVNYFNVKLRTLLN